MIRSNVRPIRRCPSRSPLVIGTLVLTASFAVATVQKGATKPDQESAEQTTEPTTAGRDRKAAVLQFHGQITDVMVGSLQRRIDAAVAAGVEAIVFDMDTPGGLVTSSIAIADMIRELTDIKTVAWVNPNAHSGGSIVAVACDEIVMARSSRMGDSQVIMGGPGGAAAVPEELQAKAYTPVLADFRQSAKKNGYSHTLCESFVLPDREVWWIEHKQTGERRFVFRDEKLELVGGEDAKRAAEPAASEDDGAAGEAGEPDKAPSPSASSDWKLVETYYDPMAEVELDVIQPVVASNQLLEMSAGEAMAYGFSKAIITDVAGLERRYDLASIERLAPSWSEDFATFLTSIYVRGFLMLIILLGAYVEFNTPGVGVAGLVALICLAIFVAGPYAAGLANVWEIILILAGIALIGVEVFVIPGFGVAGIGGIVLVMVGLLATFVPLEPGRTFPLYLPTLPDTMRYLERGVITMASSLVMSLVGMVMLSRYLPRTTVFSRVAPANPTPSDTLTEDPYRGAARVGDIGDAQTVLRPSGKALFGPILVDVVTRGEIIEPPAAVEVVERRGNRVVVRQVPERT